MRRPIATVPFGKTNALVVVCDDGTAWMWGQSPEALKQLNEYDRFQVSTGQKAVAHCWVQFHQPIPGTVADAEYQETPQ